MIHILSGEIDSGKSTAVMNFCQEAIRREVKISGWVTPAHMESGIKAGHDFVLFERGIAKPTIPFTRLIQMDDSFQYRRFHFNNEAFRLTEGLSTKCDLFVMDEIGPLELQDGDGFRTIMDQVIKSETNSLIVARNRIKPIIENLLSDRRPIYISKAGLSINSLI